MPSRRSVVEFGFMVACHTKRSPLLYIGYGCYCGLGGKGKPKDDTDRYTRGTVISCYWFLHEDLTVKLR